ncbi:MAG: hypothetical protein HKN25_04140, partial [Pyrinomonadaceae bacterium]|nr:hypothetical protein [Pyrinomonadaceae bacterium]
MDFISRHKKTSELIVLAFVSSVGILPLIFIGVNEGADVTQHFKFAETFRELSSLGNL